MTIKVRITNEEPPGGDRVLRVMPRIGAWARQPEVRLSSGQTFVVYLTNADDRLLLAETDREPCDGPAAPPQEGPLTQSE